jgi:hypothetical protein
MKRDDGGSVTAELAVALPAVVLLIVLCVASLAAAARQVRLEQAAAQAARLVARGEDDARTAGAVAALVAGATLEVTADGELVCAVVTAPSGVPLPVPPLRARSGALGGGW